MPDGQVASNSSDPRRHPSDDEGATPERLEAHQGGNNKGEAPDESEDLPPEVELVVINAVLDELNALYAARLQAHDAQDKHLDRRLLALRERLRILEEL